MQRSECLFTEHSASCMYCPLYLYMCLFSCLITGRKNPLRMLRQRFAGESGAGSLSPTSSVFASAAASASFYGKYDDQDHSDQVDNDKRKDQRIGEKGSGFIGSIF